MSVAHAEPPTIELDAARQFDFWLGDWDCTWHADGLEHVGTNSVYADLGGMVLVENFDGRPSLDYQGLSYSVYDRKVQCWRQTWVDGEGGYLTFVGRFEDGAMELRRTDESARFRMRWENIEANGLDWRYQRSDDDGRSWTVLWEIGYGRVL